MEFIRKTAYLAGASMLLLAPCAWFYFGWRAAVGVGCGLAWAMANMQIITWLVRAFVGHERTSWWTKVGLGVIKLPLLYGLGAVFVLSPWGSPVGFLAGFSLWFMFLCLAAMRTRWA